MIDKTKQYRTRDGREVRIYATDGGDEYPVHGATLEQEGWWCSETWTSNGSCYFNYDRDRSDADSNDLIEFNLLEEVKKRYPKGTKFRSMSNGAIRTSTGIFGGLPNECFTVPTDGGGWESTEYVYKNGQWAEIVEVEEMTLEQVCKELGRDIKIVKK